MRWSGGIGGRVYEVATSGCASGGRVGYHGYIGEGNQVSVLATVLQWWSLVSFLCH